MSSGSSSTSAPRRSGSGAGPHAGTRGSSRGPAPADEQRPPHDPAGSDHEGHRRSPLPSLAPAARLHAAWAGRRLPAVSVPPCIRGVAWSTSQACPSFTRRPQNGHGAGRVAAIAARARCPDHIRRPGGLDAGRPGRTRGRERSAGTRLEPACSRCTSRKRSGPPRAGGDSRARSHGEGRAAAPARSLPPQPYPCTNDAPGMIG